MASYTESSLAKQDLIGVIEVIASDNVPAAREFLEQLERQYRLLADNPEMGRDRPDLGRELRSFAFHNYIIVYRPTTDGVAIARFLHGARDIEKLL